MASVKMDKKGKVICEGEADGYKGSPDKRSMKFGKKTVKIEKKNRK